MVCSGTGLNCILQQPCPVAPVCVKGPPAIFLSQLLFQNGISSAGYAFLVFLAGLGLRPER